MVKRIKRLVAFMRSVVKRMSLTLSLFFRRERYESKVFCIGYNKTGTTTLGKSFEMLGYRHSSFKKKIWEDYYANRKMKKLLKYAAKFDSFDDLPWRKEEMIPILDTTFPNSKFVYLQRDEASWKKSFSNWVFNVRGRYPDVEKGWQNYKKHEAFVFDYFRNCDKDRFIILNVRDEHGFKKLANFLGKDTDRHKFPHYNKAVYKEPVGDTANVPPQYIADPS